MNTEIEKEAEKPNIWQWLKQRQFIGYFIISTLAFGFQWLRQNELERKVTMAENRAIHRAETAYTVGLSGLLQTATILETNLVELKQQNLLLIDCAKQKNCSNELLQVKKQKEYVPVATHYFKIKEQMIKESEGEDSLDK